jgi:hypothetical protein
MGKKRGGRRKAPLSDKQIQAILDRFVQVYTMMERTLQVPPGRSVIWRE